MKSPALVRANYFVWLVVPILAFAVYMAVGLPHVIWSYDWNPLGPDSRNDFSQRHYTRCTYIGPYGPITTAASNGECPLIHFSKPQGK